LVQAFLKKWWVESDFKVFLMKNFTGQKFGIILKDWTSVIKLKNSNGNATITLFFTFVLV
jgi:hypothetical protein